MTVRYITCPECHGDFHLIRPYYLSYQMHRWIEKDVCRLCGNTGAIHPRTAALYRAGKLYALPPLAPVKLRQERLRMAE